MKEIYPDLIKIRRQVFAEIAKLAYNDGNVYDLRQSIFRILPGEFSEHRDNIFHERAIIGERLRLALGLPVRSAKELTTLEDGIELVDVSHRVYQPPLVNVINFACMACPTKTVEITSNCRKCMGHPCINLCPVKAISFDKTQARIDKDKCIRCGRCLQNCPYHAIIKYDRPCASHCGVGAIESDEFGRAKINYDKCVSCGRCITECPFGAISDKGQIYQLIRSIKEGNEVVAIVAPSFAGQFGPLAGPEEVFEGIRRLGFADVAEVGLGADLTTMHEAEEFVENVPSGNMPFMGTSCCNSWTLLVSKNFPELIPYISGSATPMIETAYYIKSKRPHAKVVFIGPCISKKLEALRDYVKDYVDFVITYEELMGMFAAQDIELADIEISGALSDASRTARGYARSGGVAGAVAEYIAENWPDISVKAENVEGLENCAKLLKLAKAGKKNGMLLEGMACEGGCIGGPGTLINLRKAENALHDYSKRSLYESPSQNYRLRSYEVDLADIQSRHAIAKSDMIE